MKMDISLIRLWKFKGKCPKCNFPVIPDEKYCITCSQHLDWTGFKKIMECENMAEITPNEKQAEQPPVEKTQEELDKESKEKAESKARLEDPERCTSCGKNIQKMTSDENKGFCPSCVKPGN